MSCGEGKGAEPDVRKMGALEGSSSIAGMVVFVYAAGVEKGLRGIHLIARLVFVFCEAWKEGGTGQTEILFTEANGLRPCQGRYRMSRPGVYKLVGNYRGLLFRGSKS